MDTSRLYRAAYVDFVSSLFTYLFFFIIGECNYSLVLVLASATEDIVVVSDPRAATFDGTFATAKYGHLGCLHSAV